MHSTDCDHRLLGVTFHEEYAQILLWAPAAKTVDVFFHEKKFSLLRHEYGYWQNSFEELKPGDRYSFILNGDKKLPDPVSLSQPDGVHGASQAVDLATFNWTDLQWQNHDLTSYIIYEIHTGTFSEEGTFNGIAEKLDHLISLGITAIELMPVAAFPGKRNWGYDGVFPFAVHTAYGGAEKLQALINHCHKNGLAVILDVVYNHLGPEGNYLPEYGPYLTDKYKTPWGKAINFDDAGCDGVRKYFIENALMWLRDFHVDALRLDAVHAIKDFSPIHFLRELKEQVSLLTTETGKIYHLIIENDLNDPTFIDPTERKGYGMSAQWTDEFHHALRVATGQPQIGYYSDFNGIEHLAKAYRDAYVYDGIYSTHREKTFGRKADQHPGEQFVVFSQNHDQVGNRMLGERSSSLVSFEMQKLMAGAVFMSPYLPLLFMGEEWAEPNPFLYFVDHSDKELAEAVRKGRKEEFRSFQMEGEVPDPLSEETYHRSKLQWNLLATEPHKTMLGFYKILISIRKHFLPLHLFKRNMLEVHADAEKKILCLHRWRGLKEEGSYHIICLMNFSNEERQLELPSMHIWNKLLCSSDPSWLGTSPAEDTLKGGKAISLAAESFLIYTNHHV
jgi:maltooligosyltrehalose trehalohydrolase